MTIQVLLFATLRDLAGVPRLVLSLPTSATTVNAVRAALATQFPRLAVNLPSAIAAVNQEFAFGHDPVRDGDEVAFFPPVSGGMGAPTPWPLVIDLPHAPVSVDALVQALTLPSTGAVAVFTGVVRGETNRAGHAPVTDHLNYEAYTPMARAKLRQVADEMWQRWPKVHGIALVQRLGHLHVGDTTIVVACAAAHRDDGCFEAARYGIDRVKEIVPVWKREVGLTGEAWVEGHYMPVADDQDRGAAHQSDQGTQS